MVVPSKSIWFYSNTPNAFASRFFVIICGVCLMCFIPIHFDNRTFNFDYSLLHYYHLSNYITILWWIQLISKKKYCWTEHTLKSKYKQTNQNHVNAQCWCGWWHSFTPSYKWWKEIRMLNWTLEVLWSKVLELKMAGLVRTSSIKDSGRASSSRIWSSSRAFPYDFITVLVMSALYVIDSKIKWKSKSRIEPKSRSSS